MLKGKKIFFVLVTTFFLLNAVSFAVESAGNSTQEVPAQEMPATETLPQEINATSVNEPSDWVWGEVVSVDKMVGQILVKYVDYETDQEKQASFVVVSETGLENIKSLDDIGAGDSVTIDYDIDKDGRNIAKNISVEKKEISQ